jgi:hypothetical protein
VFGASPGLVYNRAEAGLQRGFAVNELPKLSPQDLTFDPLLDAWFDGSEVFQTSCAARNIRATPVRQAGVRVAVPGGANELAGALGAEFLPDQSGQLLIMVLASDQQDGGGDLLPGMPSSYARDVLGAARATEEIAALGAGVLRFDRAQRSPEHSSPELFEWMASAVIRLLVPELRQLPEDEFFALLGVGHSAGDAVERADVIWLDDAPALAPDEAPAGVSPAEEPVPAPYEADVTAQAAFVFDDILGAPAGEEIGVEPPPEDALALGRIEERNRQLARGKGDGVEDEGEEVDSVLAALLQAFYEERRGEPREPISLDFVLPAEEAAREEDPTEATLSDLLTSLYGEVPGQETEEPPVAETEWWLDLGNEPAVSGLSASEETEFSPIFDDDM